MVFTHTSPPLFCRFTHTSPPLFLFFGAYFRAFFGRFTFGVMRLQKSGY